MQTLCDEIPWIRAVRAVALMLALVLGLDMTLPVGGYAQPTQLPTSTPVASLGTQELPPMQEAEIIEERKPFYKKWWFWAIVGVVLVGGGAAAAMGGGGSSTPPSSANVHVQF